MAHQSQFARIEASTLEEALEALSAHVSTFGDRNNWWQWTVARLPNGDVRIRDLDPRDLESLPEDERAAAIADHERLLREAPPLWTHEASWVRRAWFEVLSNLDLDVPRMFGTASAHEQTRAALEGTPIEALPAWFVGRAYAALRPLYAEATWHLDSYQDRAASGTRRVLSDALEATFQDMAAAADMGRAPAAPYRSRQHPSDWPAHLVGRSFVTDQTVYLAVDMHV